MFSSVTHLSQKKKKKTKKGGKEKPKGVYKEFIYPDRYRFSFFSLSKLKMENLTMASD